MKRFFTTVVFLICFLCVSLLHAQQTDSTVVKSHSPRKATILSAVLPGAGQFYNKKYWKIPVIYGGFGTLAYFIAENTSRYNDYRKALLYRLDDDPGTVDNFPFYSAEGLQQAKNYYRRNMELSYIFSVVLYALNVVDAAVDAHLYEFDISEDLSLKVQPLHVPRTLQTGPYTGLTLTMKLNHPR